MWRRTEPVDEYYIPVRHRISYGFSEEEIKDIAIATLVLTIAFTIMRSGGISGLSAPLPFIAFVFITSLISVVTAFLLHEFAHKYVAQRYGCWAEFRKYNQGLLFALILSFFGFLFAAPGAVYISGHVSRDENGKISAAGPGVNMLIAILLLPFLFLIKNPVVIYLFPVAQINVFLGLFNLLPIPPLDGSKIWKWSIPIYITMILLSVGILFVLWSVVKL